MGVVVIITRVGRPLFAVGPFAAEDEAHEFSRLYVERNTRYLGGQQAEGNKRQPERRRSGDLVKAEVARLFEPEDERDVRSRLAVPFSVSAAETVFLAPDDRDDGAITSDR